LYQDPIYAVPAILTIVLDTVRIVQEGKDVSQRFDKYDPSRPTMKEIESVIAYVEDPYEGVIPQCKEDGRN
jgi:hypothetical protein